jgi:hypothetical protein
MLLGLLGCKRLTLFVWGAFDSHISFGTLKKIFYLIPQPKENDRHESDKNPMLERRETQLRP